MEIVGLGRQTVLPVGANVVVELAGDVGEQGITQLIESLADAVAVRDGHGGIRSGRPERRYRCSVMRPDAPVQARRSPTSCTPTPLLFV